jgi:hypothetical protein
MALFSQGKELVKPAHIGRWHLHGADRRGLTRQVQRRRDPRTARALPPHTLQQRLDVKARLGPALLDGALDLLHGMLTQKLQDADVVLGPVAGAVLPLQGRA